MALGNVNIQIDVTHHDRCCDTMITMAPCIRPKH